MDKIQKEQAREIRDVKRDLGDEIKERKNEENEINQAHQRLRGRVKRLKLRVRKIKEVVMKDQVDSDDDDKGDILKILPQSDVGHNIIRKGQSSSYEILHESRRRTASEERRGFGRVTTDSSDTFPGSNDNCTLNCG
ncbi:unnamed protein product [Lepeophtheirus salmonis]|uniref:(salmon louse) hypothetical protein n=1 Tax=Lepeophtheirus salmonis TaxID=72036 RepID=A0A7R8CB39_LEPSM|nr:unnamed protein product [Lepeophtheirus salmonis]CAF2755704.1 unnamed protein product [Lepeophtheirus salmonis]